VNFVTVHDGFTLHDVVSYDQKHNDANGDENRDGASDNHSHNWGIEGPTDDPAIFEVRQRQMRNMLATLLFAQGTPLVLGGDEMGRTQHGNNNAYCQDNVISWVNWEQPEWAKKQIVFASRLIELRRRFRVLRQNRFLTGEINPANQARDVTWITAAGTEITPEEWQDNQLFCFGMLLDARALSSATPSGSEETLLLLMNAGDSSVACTLPTCSCRRRWTVLIDTASPERDEGSAADAQYELPPQSLVLLKGEPDS
jgi:glycogen operon protein